MKHFNENGPDALMQRAISLEKLLQLELASADIMDLLIYEWAQNMRNISRTNVALECVLGEILTYCEQAGVDLGNLADKASALITREY